MLTRNQRRSVLIALVVTVSHVDNSAAAMDAQRKLSKSGKGGKGGGGGRWSGGGRWNGGGSRWDKPKWNSNNKWKSSSSGDKWKSSSGDKWWGGKDYDAVYYDDDRRPDGGRDFKPLCTLANPVQEQYDIIAPSWIRAYVTTGGAAALDNFRIDTIYHANLVMEKFMEVVEGYDDGDYDRDDIFDLGELEGDSHPGGVRFANDDQQDALCALTKALVLMMRESCGYNRWKRTLEISAYFYMDGFIEGVGVNNFKLRQCVDWDNIDKRSD